MELTKSLLEQLIKEVLNEQNEKPLSDKEMRRAGLNAKPAKPFPAEGLYDPAKTKCPGFAKKMYRENGIRFIKRNEANGGVGYTATGFKGFETVARWFRAAIWTRLCGYESSGDGAYKKNTATKGY